MCWDLRPSKGEPAAGILLRNEKPKYFQPAFRRTARDPLPSERLSAPGRLSSGGPGRGGEQSDRDEIFARIQARKIPYWADPAQRKQGEINTRDGGRGVYFEDPDGHLMEILTRPYGSGG